MSPAPGVKSVLLVDDVDEVRILTKWFLGCLGYAVSSVRSAEEALTLFDPKIHAAVVTDNRMPGMTGEELSRMIKTRSPATPVIMYSGMAPEDGSCVDVLVLRPSHVLVLKEALDKVLGARGAASSGRRPDPERRLSPGGSVAEGGSQWRLPAGPSPLAAPAR